MGRRPEAVWPLDKHALERTMTLGLLRLGGVLMALAALSSPTSAQDRIPPEYVGAWGDDETCMAFHRGDLYFSLQPDGRLLIQGNETYVPQCFFHVSGKTDTDVKLHSDCTSRDSIAIHTSENRLRMEYSNDTGDRLFLHKCDFNDVVAGIGRDVANVRGDLGTARHIAFTFGYAAAVASMCHRQIDGETTQRIMDIGREASQRYAISIQALPAETWAKRLAERRVLDGGHAAEIDAQTIPDICSWAEKAYGRDGWVVDGLFRPD